MPVYSLVVASVFASLLAAAPAGAAVLAHWNFDETSGSTAVDSVGGNNGTLAGGATFLPGGGVAGGAISLAEATGDLVNMGSIFNFGSTNFSISFWIKTTTTDTDSFPVARHHSTIVAGYAFGVNKTAAYGSPDKMLFYASNAVGGESISTTTVNDGAWHHIVGVYEQGVSKRLYVDGIPAESSTAAGGNSMVSAQFLVGGITVAGNPTAMYTGLVDELFVFDHSLSDSEITTLYECPSGACPTTTTTVPATTTTTAIVTTTTLEEPLCGAVPRSACGTAAAGKGSLKITAKGGTKNKLKWKIAKGSATDPSAFGDPTTGTPEYALCIYDERGGSQPIYNAPLEAGSGWKRSGNGFVYKNKTGNAAGLTGAKLTPGAAGKTKLSAKATDPGGAFPSLPIIGNATAQFVARTPAGTACWSTELDDVKKNTNTQFSGKTAP